MIKAPWTEQQVDALNRYQHEGRFHPFTCGNDRHDALHTTYARQFAVEHGLLTATENGWICPACNYTQDWAHDFMFAL